jgi:hypothetical protein
VYYVELWSRRLCARVLPRPAAIVSARAARDRRCDSKSSKTSGRLGCQATLSERPRDTPRGSRPTRPPLCLARRAWEWPDLGVNSLPATRTTSLPAGTCRKHPHDRRQSTPALRFPPHANLASSITSSRLTRIRTRPHPATLCASVLLGE